ncbi:MAG: homocysteine S-methyltransferase family protein [Thermodesulfobacteriota bacterium]
MDVFEKIEKQGLLFDGGMGSMLIDQGLKGGEAPELWNLTHPDRIQNIHQAYFDAGADIVSANTFGASASKLAQMGVTQSMQDINRAGVRLARQASSKEQYVAADFGSLGGMLPPMGSLSESDAIAEFARQAAVLDDEGIDLFIMETVFDINLALCALKAIKSVSEKPIICSMTFQQTPKGFFTIFGNSPEQSMQRLVEAGAWAVGANCSLGSSGMVDLAAKIRKSVDVPIVIQPNAGMPERTQDGDVFYPENETEFANNMKKIRELGIEIIGGCCGTTPAYIKKIKETLE